MPDMCPSHALLTSLNGTLWLIMDRVFIGMCLYLHVRLQICPDIVFVNVQPYPCIVFARVQPHLHTAFVDPLTHPHVAIVGLLSHPQVALIAGRSQAVDSSASPPVKSAQQQHPS
ncbi:hypothetical protein B0H13DRAFT_2306872 [Mycena leptocephala]|nr:hypothetical protein B0H13DRAFT_2306872 [Mycena leptocephala]